MKQSTFFDAGQRLQMKCCSRCKTSLSVEAFGACTKSRDGLRNECKACRRDAYMRDGERLRAKQSAYYAANAPARRAAQRAYNQANAQEIAAKERARRDGWSDEQSLQAAVQKRVWAAHNPDKVRTSNVASRHARRNAPGRFSPERWALLCRLYCERCAACGQAGQLTPDHVVALSRGGSNDIANIQPLCLPCNQRKWVKPIVYGLQPYINPEAMLADPSARHLLPEVYQNGAVQPLLFSEADA